LAAETVAAVDAVADVVDAVPVVEVEAELPQAATSTATSKASGVDRINAIVL
jgi:hypothetical protein